MLKTKKIAKYARKIMQYACKNVGKMCTNKILNMLRTKLKSIII